MPLLKFISLPLLTLLLLSGCSSLGNGGSYDFAESAPLKQGRGQRMVVKSANISIEVNQPESIVEEVVTLVEAKRGYIESMYNQDQEHIHMTVKIPATKLELFITEFAAKGKLISKSIHARDVTEESIDIEAKLKNFLVLRERFRVLLGKAEKVSEILEIEKELSRIQIKIDAIEGRRKILKNHVSFSRVEISINQETIYGPLGYIGKGFFWFFKKLFIIQ